MCCTPPSQAEVSTKSLTVEGVSSLSKFLCAAYDNSKIAVVGDHFDISVVNGRTPVWNFSSPFPLRTMNLVLRC